VSVTNGQVANQTTFNNAFVSKTETDPSVNKIIGVVGMENTTDPDSGNAITNVQQYQNEIADAAGVVGTDDATRKVYSSNNVVANGDNRKVAVGKLDAKFHNTTGHAHTGGAGDGPQISAADLADFNNFLSQWQTFTISPAVGLDDDVSAQLTGKVSGGNTTTAGVITTGSYNKCEIRLLSTDTFIEDADGQRVYGRLTEAAGVWTLTYYTNEAGVETAHTLASQNIRVYFREVFTMDTRPTIQDDGGLIGSLDMTADIVDASPTQRGVVSTGSQSFGGLKTNTDGLIIEDHFATPRSDVAGANPINALTYNPLIKITGATATFINGITSGTDGKRVVIHNGTSQILTFNHQSGSASAADRLKLPGSIALQVAIDSSVEFIYDTNQSRWVVKSAAGSGSGGGSGGSLEWVEALSAPTIEVEYEAKAAHFTADGDQNLYTTIKVPTSYGTGSPVKLKLLFYSPDNSGNVFMRSQSTLIRTGTDAFNSTTNQRTSTNTEATLGAGTVDEPQYVELDLTSSIGEINAVAISPGDQIKVRLYRDTANESTPATSAARAQIYQSESTFT